MLRLFIATQNKGKQKEINALLSDLELELVTPNQIKLHLEVAEDGINYEENALKKALAYAKETGLPTFADDSGLEVEALDGKPGIYSARYSNEPGASDADRRSYLLEQLRSHPQPWLAQFKCVVVIHDPEGNTYSAVGSCKGRIIPTERGEHGFGYDPIFLIEKLNSTMAELPPEIKNQVSHRAEAIKLIKPIIKKMIRNSSIF